MEEITGPLATLPNDPPPAPAEVDFPVVLRGYDRIAVDAYVREMSERMAEIHAVRSPEAAVRRALERVGEEVSGILQRAHEAGEQITSKSRSDAEDRLERARREAAALTAAAEERLGELDVETDRIWAERHRIVEDARLLADQLLRLADSAAERFPPEEPMGGGAAPGPGNPAVRSGLLPGGAPSDVNDGPEPPATGRGHEREDASGEPRGAEPGDEAATTIFGLRAEGEARSADPPGPRAADDDESSAP